MTEAEVHEEFFSLPEIDRGHWKEISEFVKNFGCYTSVALFDPGSEIFYTPNAEGVIGFRSSSRCAVVFGDPVCPESQIPTLIHAFQNHCSEKKQKIIYTAVSQKFTSWALENGCSTAIEVAEELFLNPQEDVLKGTKGRKLRIRINQAKKANVMTHEYTGYDLALEKQLDKVAECWLEGRSGPQIYLAHVDLFTDRIGKRWFYAKQNNKVVGVILLNQLASGWVLNLSMIIPEAPAGTSEMMVLSVLKTLQNEGCKTLSLGIVVREEVGNILGLGYFSTKLIRFFYKFVVRVLKLNGRKQYWKKFNPKGMPCYVVCPRKQIGYAEITGLLRSLNTSL